MKFMVVSLHLFGALSPRATAMSAAGARRLRVGRISRRRAGFEPGVTPMALLKRPASLLADGLRLRPEAPRASP
jgi:hypothetical protein